MRDAYLGDAELLRHIAAADDAAASYYDTRPAGLVADPRSAVPQRGEDLPGVTLASAGEPISRSDPQSEPDGASTSRSATGKGQQQERRTWSGLNGYAGKAMLSKFAVPLRSHLLDLYVSKGANFDPKKQHVPEAVPNVVERANLAAKL